MARCDLEIVRRFVVEDKAPEGRIIVDNLSIEVS